MKPLALALLILAALPGRAADTLPALVRWLGQSPDPQAQLDVVRGLRDATQGRPRVPMPEGWPAVEEALARSPNAEVRSLSRSLGLTFGSETALQALRALLRDPKADTGQRQEALRALSAVRDTTLPAALLALLEDPALRGAAVRGLAGFDEPGTPAALLKVYPALAGTERRDALNTLASRPAYAAPLLAAVAAGTVPSRDLTAEVIRQLRSLKDDGINGALTRVYGAVREVTEDKQAEITRYRRLYAAGGSTPGDAIRGRTVFVRICQQCHQLFEVGGLVGPDLTGSNRGDLDYLLQNMLDPNAVIPNEYRASTLELKDGRVLTGIVKAQDDRSVTVATANETLTLPRAEVSEIVQGQLSMMPEGLLQPLADQEFRDLVYYLGRSGQSPLLASPDTVNLFFNGRDLALWQGDDARWSVQGGEIVGRSAVAANAAALLTSDMIAGDFRLALQVRVQPDDGGSTGPSGGVFFRAEPGPGGALRGYRLELGGDSWGRLVEEREGGNGRIPGPGASPRVKRGDWNQVEIRAEGGTVETSVNGAVVARATQPGAARQGLIALVLGPGGAAEVRFKDLRLELLPAAAR